MEGTTAKGFRHGLVDDRGYSTMMQSTKLATKRTRKNVLRRPSNPSLASGETKERLRTIVFRSRRPLSSTEKQEESVDDDGRR